MTVSQVEKQWKSGSADAVYFFYGEEEFLRSELIRKSIDILLPDIALRSFNLDQFDGSDATLRDILTAVKAYPVMSDVRLVICKNAEKLFTARSDERKAEENDKIKAYLEEPNRSTVLILDSSKPGAKNTNPWKMLHAKATPVECEALSEREAEQWLGDRAGHYGKGFEREAASLLVSLVGTDLRALSNELEKLVTFTGESTKIATADVEACIGISPNYNIFELTKAIGFADKARANEIVIRMLDEDKSSYFLMFVMLGRYFEDLAIAKELAGARSSEQSIAEALGLFGGRAYFVKDYLAAARKYSKAAIDNAIRAIVNAEDRTRHSHVDHVLLFQRLISEIVPN